MTSSSTITNSDGNAKYGRAMIRAFLAGVCISIGGCVYMACEPKWVGAILFAVGLLTVVAFKLDLYTGKVGYVVENPPNYLWIVLISIIGNFIGCLFVGLMMQYAFSPAALLATETAVAAKLDLEWYAAIFKGILCGMLMFIAVDFFKQRQSFLAIFFCVPVFILAGFEHSIADMFYFCAAGVFSLDALVFIILVIIGNGIGGILIPACRKYMYYPA